MMYLLYAAPSTVYVVTTRPPDHRDYYNDDYDGNAIISGGSVLLFVFL